MPESQLRQRIRQGLQRAFPGALVIGWPGNFWSGAGWPDLLYLDWPLLLGLEVKQGRRSKPTPVQGARHSLLRKHHVPVYVVHTPSEAVSAITSLKEKLPMAFDPALLAELDAALSDAPAPAAEPEVTVTSDERLETTEDLQAAGIPGTIDEQHEAAVTASANGVEMFEEIKLDADLPAPDIEDLTAAIVANADIAAAQADQAMDIASAEVDVLLALVDAMKALTLQIEALRADLSADDETPAPRRRTKRS